MYCIVTTVPMYNDNDSYCGAHHVVQPGYRYETLALATAMSNRLRDEEISAYVADAADPLKRVQLPVAETADCFDDIPF